ncbi:hypothetical protein SAMN05216436_11615 [bacterium A37T11]|nr:hypothetical protein SAMN05216436_11615 [bacterium A37T11]
MENEQTSLILMIYEELVLIRRYIQQHHVVTPTLLNEEQILADRMETDAVLQFLGMTINPFKEHVMNKKLFPMQTFGQRHIYSKQELLKLFVR